MEKFIDIQLVRSGATVSIELTIPKEFEEFYKALSGGEKQVSTRWMKGEAGAEFYNGDKEQRVLAYLTEGGYSVFSDYGAGLTKNGLYNIAILRTVGSSSGVKITADRFAEIDGIELESYVRYLATVSKVLWKMFIAKKSVTARITFEV